MRIAVLTWRDTSHPDGGGSEVFVESVGRELVARGHDVTLLCARHPGSAPRELRDGVRLRRLGSRLTVYLWGLAWLVWHRRDVDVVVDVINGLPFASPVVRRRGVVALVHVLRRRSGRAVAASLAKPQELVRERVDDPARAQKHLFGYALAIALGTVWAVVGRRMPWLLPL